MAYHVDGKLAQPVVITIGESLTWRHDNAFASVNTKRVEVFHVADGHAIVVVVSDDLVFHFLPPGEYSSTSTCGE